MDRQSQEKKSPLRTAPLRTPGQSLSEEVYDIIYGRIMQWVVTGVLLLVLAGYEWLRWLSNSPPRPVALTVLAVLGCGIIAWRVKRQIPLLRQLGQGHKGEKMVGQCLERLRAKGYEIFHDIVGDGHNIDHALVGPGGVFVIETKTISKPARGASEVVFDGESITVNGLPPDRDPVTQVLAAARELAAIIRDTSGREVPVRPVILYPGWYTKQPPSPNVWVLNENAFPKFIAHEDVKLSADEVARIASGIAMHVRGAEKVRAAGNS